MTDAALSIRDVSKYYKVYANELDRIKEIITGKPRFQKIEALKPVTLDILKGEVLGVIGQNGAGKSTLLKVLSKTILPSTGEFQINGRIAALLELGASFHREMTGHENIYLYGAIQGLSTQEVNAIYQEVIEFADIGEFIHRPVKTYSSGMFVRLAFSMATQIDPEVLIIDEALSVGDGAFSRKSLDRIMDFKNAGKTILFCSHSMYQVEALCDRVVWLDGGRVRKVGNPVEVITEYSEMVSMASPKEEGLGTVSMASPKEEGLGTVSKADRDKIGEKPDHKNTLILPALQKIAISVDGHEGKVHKVVSQQSDLEITVQFSPGEGVPMPSVAVAFSGGDGRIISSTGSYHDNIALKTNAEGEGEVTIVFPKLALLRGTYYVDIALLCEKGIHLYEAVRRAAEIHVEQAGLERGIVMLEHEWKA